MFDKLLRVMILVVLFISFYQEEKLMFELSFSNNNSTDINNAYNSTNVIIENDNEREMRINSTINDIIMKYNANMQNNVEMNENVNAIIPLNISTNDINTCIDTITLISVLKNRRMRIYNESGRNALSKTENKIDLIVDMKYENETIKIIDEIIDKNNITVYFSIYYLYIFNIF